MLNMTVTQRRHSFIPHYSIPEALRTSNQRAIASVQSEILPSVTEFANTRLSKVVMIRAEEHARLPLPDFLVLSNEGWAFVVKCEVLARKMIVPLRGVLASQVCLLCQIRFGKILNFD